jgi:CDP-glucose 4,6-dehydratase
VIAREAFWAGRRVLLTGQTGFKGAWLARWLVRLGAEVHGFGLAPHTRPDLFSRLRFPPGPLARLGDLRDRTALSRAVTESRPSVVIHMAAQALVRRSYREPLETVATNVDGTLRLLEALRADARVMAGLAAVLVVTTDKVYRNDNEGRAFRESDALGGHDPYSASKAAAEILTASWSNSFFAAAGIPLATARAGNVVGGGDFSEDRLVPDLWRAARAGRAAELRNPHATRPWQFVLDPLAGYLAYVAALAGPRGAALPRALNFGPRAGDSLTVAQAATRVLDGLGAASEWTRPPGAQPAEAATLTLDAGLAAKTLGWRARLPARAALDWAVEWYRGVDSGADPDDLTTAQLDRYEALEREKTPRETVLA